MSFAPMVSRLFAFLLPRKFALGLILTGCLLAALFFLRDIRLAENIDVMLPDDATRMAEDFRLLSHAPFLSKVLVVLEREPHTSPEDLARTARAVRAAVGPPWFKAVADSEEQPTPLDAMHHLLGMLPVLLTENDLARIDAMLDPKAVNLALEEARETLVGLQGLGLKRLIRSDPLQFRRLAMEKLNSLDLFGQGFAFTAASEGVFVGANRDNALIVLDTPVAMTDAMGSRELLAQLERIVDGHLAAGMHASIIGGHAYTAANASSIRQDLAVVLIASSLGFLAVFMLFLRTWRAVLVYAVPLASMLAGIAAVAATSPAVSGITLGFGAVLMGISVDYGLHVYYRLQRSPDPAKALLQVSRPILFCWLTTCGVFSLLLFSSLPGQRQLALFTVVGLSAAILLALVALPVFLAGNTRQTGSLEKQRSPGWPPGLPTPSGRRRKLALAAFFGLMAAAALCWPAIRFDGRLQSLSMVSENLTRTEATIAKSWGGVRSLAMLFTQDQDPDRALSKADALWNYLTQTLPRERIISLSPLLPPQSKQQAAILRWEEFWAQRGPELKQIMDREGASLGFAASAFSPFFEHLFAKPQQATIDDLHALGIKELADMLIVTDKESISIITLAPDSVELHALFETHREGFPQALADARLVSQSRLGKEIAAILHRDMTRFLVAAGALVVIIVALLFRDARRSLQALIPAVAGLCALILAVTLLDIAFNLYSIAATFLVLGLGVDYGIFMAARNSSQEDLGTETAVLVSGLTTLVGFGALVMADHPALHSIGLTVLVGIAATIPAALFVVPALAKNKHHA